MNPKQAYAEKLRDPRWQKKRLEIFQRDGWKCRFCDHDELELHVHHLRYSGGPWEAPSEDLITLCEQCHGTMEDENITLPASTFRHVKTGARILREMGIGFEEVARRCAEREKELGITQDELI